MKLLTDVSRKPGDILKFLSKYQEYFRLNVHIYWNTVKQKKILKNFQKTLDK